MPQTASAHLPRLRAPHPRGRRIGSAWAVVPLAALALLVPAANAAGQPVGEPATHAERSGWSELTPHEGVVRFYEELAARAPEMRLREFGRSAEGRQLLEVTLARPAVADPWEAHDSGKPIVLINAQVHGDEPAGKEALMLFARDVALGPLNHLLDSVVLVLSPQLNPDGAEAGDWGSRNNLLRRNVNRDYLRLANPETRAFVQNVLSAWRPHVVLDAHELVGPPRIYDFYTSFPRYIEGPTDAYELTRRELVPTIVEALESAGYDHVPYHRVPGGLADDPSQGVSAGSYGARALSSYGGAQAGITLLHESMRPRDAREDLENRTRRHRVAMTALAGWVAEHPGGVLDAVARERAELVERGSRWDPADTIAIRLEQVASRELDYRMVSQGDTVEFAVPLLDSTVVRMGRVRPVGYLIDPDREEVAHYLALHGIQVERLLAPTTVEVESYVVEDVARAASVYEGYVPRGFRTQVEAGALEAPAGAFLVRMDQPEARIIGHLMEPEDENSLATMGWLATDERSGATLPFHRLRRLPEVSTEVVTGHDHRGAPVWRGGARAEVPPDREAPARGGAAAGSAPVALADLANDELTPHTTVTGWFRELAASSPWVQMGRIGHSREGRPLHVVSLSRPSVKSPWEAHASGKPILFIGAQVHGDEPAGKEALMRFAGDLVNGPLEHLLDEIIFLFVPQFNPDGAEAGRWGSRANTAGYNLNRDWLRLDNPETRAVVEQVLLPWRPHVVVDAHELGGPPRVYDFYTWHPTNPHGPRSTMELVGNRLGPAVVGALEDGGWSHVIYHTPGGLNQLVSDPEIGISVPVYGRTLNDYAASQGMATILFESLRESDARVGIADRADRHRTAMEALARSIADDPEATVSAFREGRAEMIRRGARWDPADSIAVLREPAASRTVEYVVAEQEQVETDEGPRLRYTGGTVTVETPVFDSARVTLGRVRPEGYLVAPHREDLARALLDHGLMVEEVLEEAEWRVEQFRVDSLDLSSSVYEGYVPQRFRTTLEPESLRVPAGSFLVRAAQPGAALVFHLLEPEDENSLAITGAFLSEARVGGTLPVQRVVEIPAVRVRRLDGR